MFVRVYALHKTINISSTVFYMIVQLGALDKLQILESSKIEGDLLEQLLDCTNQFVYETDMTKAIIESCGFDSNTVIKDLVELETLLTEAAIAGVSITINDEG